MNFMNAVSLGLLVQSIRKLAAFVNSRPQDIVLVPNATTGTPFACRVHGVPVPFSHPTVATTNQAQMLLLARSH